MTHFIVLAISFIGGYMIGSAGARYQRKEDIQALIDLEAVQRRADGIHRKGDELTEIEPHMEGVYQAREVKR
jgi:hypothetical protein